MKTHEVSGRFRGTSRCGSLTSRATVGAAAAMMVLTLLGLPSSGAGAAQSQAPTLSQARKDLLTLADMPSGWTSAKNTNSNSEVGSAQLAHCVGVATALVSENPPSVNSKEFQNADDTLEVTDNVTVFPSAKNAAAEF